MRGRRKLKLIQRTDVLFVGPLMIRAAMYRNLPVLLRVGLFLNGAATIVYNGSRLYTPPKLSSPGSMNRQNIIR